MHDVFFLSMVLLRFYGLFLKQTKETLFFAVGVEMKSFLVAYIGLPLFAFLVVQIFTF